jgi:hypothetical protein
LLDTGLWTAARNRPPELARTRDRGGGPVPTFGDFVKRMESLGHEAKIADVVELGRFVLAEIAKGSYVIGHDLERSAALLHARADAIAAGALPPHHGL